MAKTDWNKADVEIERSGHSITLPKDPDMPIKKAIEALERRMADEEQPYKVHEVIDAYPFDAAVACMKAMKNLYGWASPQTEIINTFFGKVKKPPDMISIPTGPHDEDVIQAPLGAFLLPGVDEFIHTRIWEDGKGRAVFLLHGEVKKKSKDLILALANETRRIVKEESIYRGKAIRLPLGDEGEVNMSEPPVFLDLSQTDEVIFDDDIQEQINHSILAPIIYTDEVKKVKTPLKRTVLLSGKYGTGKSLTARMTAKRCVENGWTFVMVERVQGLKTGLEMSNRFGRAVVFAEDIDRVVSTRDEAANDLINLIDGVLSKRSEVMTILTTNFPENIDRAMLRPGRLDAVIALRPPSETAVERLIRVYSGKLLDEKESVKGASKALTGQIPATIREAVERAKLGMVWRRANKLTDSDLVTAAKTMTPQLDLLNKDKKEQTTAEKLAESLRKVVVNGSDTPLTHLTHIREQVDDIHNSVV